VETAEHTLLGEWFDQVTQHSGMGGDRIDVGGRIRGQQINSRHPPIHFGQPTIQKDQVALGWLKSFKASGPESAKIVSQSKEVSFWVGERCVLVGFGVSCGGRMYAGTCIFNTEKRIEYTIVIF